MRLFMPPQVMYQVMLVVETTAGSELVPADLVGEDPSAEDLRDFLEGDPYLDDDDRPDITREEGFYARFSAPGYLDATDWVGPEETEDAALDALADQHDVCRNCYTACWDSDEPCEEGEGE